MLDRDTTFSPVADSQINKPVIGLITLGASVGIELMLLVFLRWGPLPPPAQLDRFTAHIAPLIAPERDLPIFAAGIVGTLGLTAGFVWIAGRWRQANPRRRVVAEIILALIGFAGFFALLPTVAPADVNDHRSVTSVAPLLLALLPSLVTTCVALTPVGDWVVDRVSTFATSIGIGISFGLIFVQFAANGAVGLTALLAVVLWTIRCERHAYFFGKRMPWRSLLSWTCSAAAGSLAIFYCVGGGTTFAWFSQWRWCVPALAVLLFWCADLWIAIRLQTGQSYPDTNRSWTERRETAGKIASVLFAAFLIICLFIPRQLWPGLAGSFYRRDQLHHWNYFAFGPALAFSHGAALGTAVYSQYGVGWPLLFGALHRMLPLTYANVIGVSAAVGCGYFVLLFFFLRLLLRSTGWAATGTIVAVTLQIFSGTWPGVMLWNYPSSTMLRHPLDVCGFLALLAFLRRKNVCWFLTATAVAGLAVAFELDTGIHLLVATAFFWLLHILRRRRPGFSNFWTHLWTTAIGGVATAVGTWLLLLGLAGRGHLFHADFWSGYFEGMRVQVLSGLSLLPISNVPLDTLIPFGVICMLYVIGIAWGSWKSVTAQGSATRPMFLATISVYGLGIMLLFVGRSHPLNLLHVTVPLGMVMAIAGAMLSQDREGFAASSSMGWCFAICLIVLLMSKPEFEEYPNLLHSNAMFARRPIALRSDPPDLAGFKNADRDMIKSFHQIARTMQDLPVSDRQIVVLDERDTLLDYLSNRSPWSRYTSLFHGLLTWEQVRELQTQLRTARPMYLVMRHEETPRSDFVDVWLALRPTVAKYYKLARTAGDYELWQAKKAK